MMAAIVKVKAGTKMERTTLVYRVEDRHGTGPYRNLYGEAQMHLSGELGRAHNAEDTHPAPRADGIEFWNHAEVCGFSTRQEMATWFEGFGNALADAGYRVSVYRVPVEDVQSGKRQVMFFAPARGPLRTIAAHLVIQ